MPYKTDSGVRHTQGIEFVVVGGIVIALLFLGPKKIPELARGIGRAWGELIKGRKELQSEIEEVTHGR